MRLKWAPRIGMVIVLMAILYVGALIYQDSQLAVISKTLPEIQIEGSTLTGYKEGRLTFKVDLQTVSKGDAKSSYMGNQMNSGVLYDVNETPIVDQITAENAFVDTQHPILNAQGAVTGRYLTPNGHPILIEADQLHYWGETKMADLYGALKLTRDKTVLVPQKSVQIDFNANTLTIDSGFTLHHDAYRVSGNRMIIDILANTSQLEGAVKITRKPDDILDEKTNNKNKVLNQFSSLYCQYLQYNYDTHTIKIRDQILIDQTGKEITADEGMYDENQNVFHLFGNVTIKVDDLNWLISAKNDRFDNEELRTDLSQKTVITSDQFQFDGDTKKLDLIGNVTILLRNKSITAAHVTLLSDTDQMVLNGNVHLKHDNGDEIQSESMYLDINTESVSAKNGVKTYFLTHKKN